MRNLRSVLVTKYFSGDQIENNEMVGSYVTYGKQKMHIKNFGKKLRKRDNLEDLHVDWKIILKWIFKAWFE
jgi:hypothetical protein